MSDDQQQPEFSGGRIRARGFVGASRGGRNGNGRPSGGGGGWPGSEQHRGQIGSFQHRQQQFQNYGAGRSPGPQSPYGGGEAGPVEEVSALVRQSSPSVHRSSERAFQRGGGAAGGRGGMRGNRYLPEIVITRKPGDAQSKQGKLGTPVILQTNYFKVIRQGDERLYLYRVDFTPPVETRKAQNSIMFTLKPQIGGYLFDGTQLFTRNKLCDEEIQYNTKYNATNDDYTVKLRRVGVVEGTNEAAFQVYNLMNRKAMGGLKLQLIGRNFFDPDAKVNLAQYKIDLYPGYITSIRQHETDVLMCAELTHKVMRTDTCFDLFEKCMHQRGNFQDNYKREIIGSTVMTTYGSNKTYVVNDVDFSMSPQSTFETKNGPITFLQYFRDRYNVTIKDKGQPMLISRSKARDIRAGMPELIILVPELSRITGLSDEMRRDFQLMRGLAEHTRLAPDRRIARLETFNQRLQYCKDSADIFRFWKTELDRRLVEVQGRVLPPETIFFHPESEQYKMSAGDTAEWQMAFRNNPMFLTVSLTNWAIVIPGNNQKNVNDFLSCLYQASRQMHFLVEEPQFVPIHNDSPVVYMETLNQLVQRDPQLIMCIVTNDKVDRYAAIKKKCCVDRAVPTQVIKCKTITPKGGNPRTLMSVATKVAIQLNCKLGGIPWIVKSPLLSVMCLGFDVCRDTKDRNKTYGALVAAMYHGKHRYHPNFYSTVNQHANGAELSDSLALNVVKALRAYQKQFENNLPGRIVVYRDGVGDGDLQYVHEYEVGAIRDKIESLYKACGLEAKFCFIVVSKRINTRLFNRRQNPVPGTIVDDVITLPERNDFYLISQNVRQGTVSPTSYNVLYNGVGLDVDKLQQYSFKQTHMYYNWSGTVQVPAVCQYAHKLAALAGQYLHQPPSTWLEKKLYFL
ncbi:piwi [Culex quinquefasciatus]|uniref:Piwi n=1 Tax=Culex quinquefasciatus TaxID=7176 RepID=B0XE74_CULQU|nr:piwi [Culex quinquefasciatus]|eukprot:XP_001867946.1 piwi [Culex quinquefasciatus]